MSRFISLLRFQIKLLVISPSTYAAAFLFVCMMGLVYILGLNEVSASSGGKTPMDMFFSVFWLPVLFMIPMLTMRSLAEERRIGTLHALMTTPVSAFQIVFAKFLACYFLYIFLWALTLIFPIFTVLYFPSLVLDDRMFALSKIFMGYAFIFISGAFYVAIGIFASSVTRTTLVAGMLSFCILFIAVVGSSLISKFVDIDPSWGLLVENLANYLQSFRHLEDFGRSLLDTRPFFLYFSGAAAFIAATSLITEYKNS